MILVAKKSFPFRIKFSLPRYIFFPFYVTRQPFRITPLEAHSPSKISLSRKVIFPFKKRELSEEKVPSYTVPEKYCSFPSNILLFLKFPSKKVPLMYSSLPNPFAESFFQFPINRAPFGNN